MGVINDFQKIAFGGDNQTVNVYKLENGSYQEKFSSNIGNNI